VGAISTSLVICLDQTFTVSDALQLLYTNGIHSAPVISEETRGCIGSVDVLDLLSYILTVALDSPSWAVEVSMRFRTPIYRAIDFSKKNAFIPFLETATLLEVMPNLSLATHRMPIINATSNVVGILSQSDILEFVRRKLDDKSDDQVNTLGRKLVADLSYPTKVVSISNNSTLLTAFEMLSTNRLNGIAVVNQHGVLVGNVSASDFKGVSQNNFVNMGITLQQYITTKPYVVTTKDTFASTVRMMSNNVLNRVYVVTADMKPVGVITLTDMMKFLTKEFRLEGVPTNTRMSSNV